MLWLMNLKLPKTKCLKINNKIKLENNMRKIGLIFVLLIAPVVMFSQNAFDSFENEKDVTSVVVTKTMFKLLSKMDLNSDDPEAQSYLKMVNSLNDIKIFTTENPGVSQKMDNAVKSYLSSSKALEELMRINDDGQNIRFYVKEGKDENHVSELLMHLSGAVNGKSSTIIMSISGDIDLKQLSQLTQDLKVPGSEQLKDIDKKKKSK